MTNLFNCTMGNRKLHTALSTLDCETHVELRDNELFGVVKSQYSRMNLHGKKQEDMGELGI